MRVEADEQRPINAVLRAVAANRLRNGEDVPFVEPRVNEEPRVTRCAKAHAAARRRTDPARSV